MGIGNYNTRVLNCMCHIRPFNPL